MFRNFALILRIFRKQGVYRMQYNMCQKEPDAVLIREEERHYAEELLKEAFAQNRLDLDEYEKRTDLLVNARTRAELELIINDIAKSGSYSESRYPKHENLRQGNLNFPHITVMGERTSSLELSSGQHVFTTVMGSNKVHIKASPLCYDVLKIFNTTIMGELVIYVPAGVPVQVNVVPIMAEVSIDPRISQNIPGANPEVIISGTVIMGEIRIVQY